MRIGRDDRQSSFVQLVEVEAAKQPSPMVANCNRRFEVDGRIVQAIGGMIVWSPKDVRPKR
jgi:hypothetical protein